MRVPRAKHVCRSSVSRWAHLIVPARQTCSSWGEGELLFMTWEVTSNLGERQELRLLHVSSPLS